MPHCRIIARACFANLRNQAFHYRICAATQMKHPKTVQQHSEPTNIHQPFTSSSVNPILLGHVFAHKLSGSATSSGVPSKAWSFPALWPLGGDRCRPLREPLNPVGHMRKRGRHQSLFVEMSVFTGAMPSTSMIDDCCWEVDLGSHPTHPILIDCQTC